MICYFLSIRNCVDYLWACHTEIQAACSAEKKHCTSTTKRLKKFLSFDVDKYILTYLIPVMNKLKEFRSSGAFKKILWKDSNTYITWCERLDLETIQKTPKINLEQKLLTLVWKPMPFNQTAT